MLLGFPECPLLIFSAPWWSCLPLLVLSAVVALRGPFLVLYVHACPEKTLEVLQLKPSFCQEGVCLCSQCLSLFCTVIHSNVLNSEASHFQI